MTEVEWLGHWKSFANVKKMANEFSSIVTKRKIRLIACACCRRLWDSLQPHTRELLLLAEKHADRRTKSSALPTNKDALSGLDRLSRAVQMAAYRHDNFEILIGSVREARWAKASDLPDEEFGEVANVEAAIQIEIVKEILGPLPFNPVSFDPRWLTSTVVDLATAIYDERAFDRMPILADALMDAGCDNEEMIAHCRGDGPHVRGCWVVDLLLGKE